MWLDLMGDRAILLDMEVVEVANLAITIRKALTYRTGDNPLLTGGHNQS